MDSEGKLEQNTNILNGVITLNHNQDFKKACVKLCTLRSHEIKADHVFISHKINCFQFFKGTEQLGLKIIFQY